MKARIGQPKKVVSRSMIDKAEPEVFSITRPWTLLASWMDSAETEFWFNQLAQSIKWEKPIVRVYGREYSIPRLAGFMANRGINYSYSGVNHLGEGFPKWFTPLIDKVNIASNESFNGCLLNFYRDGNDHMGWHRDNETEIVQDSKIASLSLGATRDFCLKHRYQRLSEVLNLKTGDLLIMQAKCQIDWIHSLPIRRRVDKARINLTFRRFIETTTI